MQRIVSYADPAVGAVFFNVAPRPQGRLGAEVVSAARARRSSAQAAQDYPMLLAAYIDTHHHTLVLHEWCHILQALVYPGLFFRCVREMHLVNGILSELRDDSSPSIRARVFLPEAWQYVWSSQLRPFRVDVTETGENRSMPAPHDDRPRPNNLTENDLLEDDASVFQYKAEIASPGTGTGYAQWLRERNRYTMTFKLLARLLGGESAFIALPAIVRAAFSTTRPMPVFASLLAFLIREGRTLPQQLGSDATQKLLMDSLRRSNLKQGRPDPSRPPYEDELLYIDPRSHAELVGRSVLHPLWPLARQLWPKVGDGDGERVARFLRLPHESMDRKNDSIDPWVKEYWPPAMVLRLLHPEVAMRDTVCVFSERYAHGTCAFMPDVKYSVYLPTMIANRSLAIAVATDFYRSATHNCPHSECRFFPLNLCKRWWKVPEQAEQCEFPSFVEGATLRRLDAAEATLVKLEGAAK